MLDKILSEPLFPIDSMMLDKMIGESGITILTGTELSGVEDGKILIESNGQQSSVDCLEEKLKDKVKDIVTVGDAAVPRKILNATWEGYHAIRALAERDA